MRLAAVVLNYYDSKRVYDLVNELLSYKLFDLIVISDNDSKDENIGLINGLKDPTIKVLYNKKNLGFSGGNNAALDYLKDQNIDYVYLVNSDVHVEKGLLIKSKEFLDKNDKVAIVSTKMNEYGEEKQNFYNFPTITHYCLDFLGFIKLFHVKPKIKEKHDDYILVDYIRSSYWCVRYEEFKEVNFFDLETKLYHIETCVGIKLDKIGYGCAILTNEKYDHNHIYKEGYKMRGYKDSYNSLKYIFKHYYHKNFIQMGFLACSYYIGLLIRKVMRIK